MVPNQQLVPAPDDHVPTPDFRRRYLQAVGSLMYAMLGTHVDLAHVVGVLGCHAARPDNTHWAAVLRALQYIRGTLDYGLEYTPDSSPLRGFEAYSDSDWGACPTTSRSTMGYVFLLANGAVSWSSKLQPRVTASSTEAEYLGLSHACKETVYLTQLLGELGFPAEGAAVLYGDNQGANALSKDPQFHSRTRHLPLTEQFVREQVQDGSICVEYIPTARMLADAITKSQPAPLFEGHRDAFRHSSICSIEHNSRSAVPWTNLGLFYLVHGDEELADQAFLKAQVLDPDWAAAWVGQSTLADMAGHAVEASVLLEHAVSLGGYAPEADIAFASRAFDKYRPSVPSLSISVADPSPAPPPSASLKIKEGYLADDFCVQVVRNLGSSSEFERKDGLIYYEGNRILVPDVLRRVPGEQVKANKVAGKLHSLPVPVRPFSDVALDFVGPLPSSEEWDMLLMVTDRLTGYTRLFLCQAKDEAKDIAEVVFRGWFSLFGLPDRMVSDRDKLFTSRFWRVLHSRLGLKLQMSTAFHPETDGRSERTNKTVIQVLRHYVSRQQKDWMCFLPTTEYVITAAENASTGNTPFELVLGFTPSLSPRHSIPSNVPAVDSLLDERNMKIKEVREALAVSKVRQAEQANKRRSDEETFATGNLVLVDSRDRWMRYKLKHGDRRAAKLFPRWDGPFEVVEVFPDTSTYHLQLTHDDKSHPVFHISKLKRYNLNDVDSFPSREPPRPGPIDVDGKEEFKVEAIVDEKGKGRGLRYLVKWRGYPDTDNGWEPLANVEGTEALKRWRERKR
ncbi:hypothetical protein Rt10032_c02g1197 [Rhodotorula toruloides]|uniref:Uncharacterized protein n=1 Tax=Rhodotorula toruloides TaxID=5286 RepID=A0A511K9Z9_RHOTO|nr:hypothetical protein Rt10032_c02g1197 [Rhodotorula toruloides]